MLRRTGTNGDVDGDVFQGRHRCLTWSIVVQRRRRKVDGNRRATNKKVKMRARGAHEQSEYCIDRTSESSASPPPFSIAGVSVAPEIKETYPEAGIFVQPVSPASMDSTNSTKPAFNPSKSFVSQKKPSCDRNLEGEEALCLA